MGANNRNFSDIVTYNNFIASLLMIFKQSLRTGGAGQMLVEGFKRGEHFNKHGLDMGYIKKRI